MALLEVFCNAFATFLSHADDINLWPVVTHLTAISSVEDGTNTKLQMDPHVGVSKEFMEIKAYGMRVRQEFPQSVGQLPENKDKNRYRDIIPFDKTRVIIDDADTYFNASVVEGLSNCCTYVAAQAPLSGQINDFWRMVIRYRCPAIVMLCDLVEAGRGKCAKYWPDEIGSPRAYGNVVVTLVAEERVPSSVQSIYTPVCRIFEVFSTSDDGRSVMTCCRQYQLNGWPDHGVPSSSAITCLIDLASLLIHTYPPSPHRNTMDHRDTQSPLLVHCSAGCGRSGVFISLHQICVLLKLHQVDSNLFSSGLAELVKSLRYQRPSMVQTYDQYVFLYQMVATLLRRVSRSCLRRLSKMGVSVVSVDDGEHVDTSFNSPSPPPPKPPDPFRSSNSSLSHKVPPGDKQSQSSTQLVPAGRLLATEIASELVVANRASDWSILRRVSTMLARSLSHAVQPLLTSPSLLRSRGGSFSIQRRASTVETPSVARRLTPTLTVSKASIALPRVAQPERLPHIITNGQHQPPPRPVQPATVVAAAAAAAAAASAAADNASALTRLEGVEKQLAQLVGGTGVASPISPRGRRPPHRRQLSGSYDNISELGVDNNVAHNDSAVMTSSLSVNTSELPPLAPPITGETSKIVVDLSNISPPQLNGNFKPEEPTTSALPRLPPVMLMAASSPPPPVPPPRRRRRQDEQHQHHMSFAHLVLSPSQPNSSESGSGSDSVTLGRTTPLSPRSAPLVFDDGVLKTNGTTGSTTKIVRNYSNNNSNSNDTSSNSSINKDKRSSLIRQNSLIFKNAPVLAKLAGLDYKPDYERGETPFQTPRQRMSFSPSMVPSNDNNPYASLGRFRSVAQLGLNNSRHGEGTRRSLDVIHPTSTPSTPVAPPSREQPTPGRSI